MLKSLNSNFTLAVHSPKLNQAKTHFLSHHGRGHWMKGSPSLSPPRSQGKGTGGGFPNTSMVFGEGESFFKQFNGFRGRGEAKWINGFSMFFKVNPGCPRSFFLAFFKQNYTFMSSNLVFFQQYHYCKLHSRICCKCMLCPVDKIVKIRLL